MFFHRFLSEIYRNIHVFLLLPLPMSDVSDTAANDSTHGWNVNHFNPMHYSVSDVLLLTRSAPSAGQVFPPCRGKFACQKITEDHNDISKYVFV